jgi:hypothetical protein
MIVHATASRGIDRATVVAMVSALLALLGVLVAGVLASRAQRRHYRFTEQAAACAGMLREYAAVHLQLARAAREGHSVGAQSSTEYVDWKEWEEALGVLNLLADHLIVESGHKLDHVLWEVSVGVRRGRVTWDTWAESRDSLDAARLDFVNVARSSLGRGNRPLLALGGRPTRSDPVWLDSG